MYQLIVSDYDGTLVENDKPITNSFYTKVNMLAARGIIFAVASGRPYNQLKKLLYPISNETVFISDDGAQVMYHNCLLYKNVVPMNAAKEISKLALNNGMVPIVSLREENRSVSEEKLSLPFFFSSDIFKVIIVKNGKSTDEIKTNAEKLNLRICYEDDTYIEFCNKSANKGEAVKKLMQRFSVAPDKMIAFGDGKNDLPMLELTQNRFTTRSACEEVKRISTVLGSVEDYIGNMLGFGI